MAQQKPRTHKRLTEAPNVSLTRMPPSTSGCDRPAAFLTNLHARFQAAAHNAGGKIDKWYRIGGKAVRLKFAGNALIPPLASALTHLETKKAPSASLTVSLFDSESTRIKIPPPPWSFDDFVARGEIRDFSDENTIAAFNPDACALSMMAKDTGQALYWTRNASQVPYYETGAPLKTIFHWWLQSIDCQLLHAAAVGTPLGGVLLAGKGGSGKTTASLACLGSTLGFAGDDYVGLHPDRTPSVFSLYRSAKLRLDQMVQMCPLLPRAHNYQHLGGEKALLLLSQRYPLKLIQKFPLKAILVPTITGNSGTHLKPASPADVIKAMAPSTIFQLPGAGREVFHLLSHLVRNVPGYILHMGTQLKEIPPVIVRLLRELEA